MEQKYNFLETPEGVRLRYYFSPAQEVPLERPTVLLLQGRASYLERFSHVFERLNNFGFDVWSFDWRGQGLSSRFAGAKGYVESYEQYLDDLEFFVDTFLKTAKGYKPFVIIGQSMGGHLALRYAMRCPNRSRGIMLAAPMLNINTGIWGPKLAWKFSRFMTRIGLGKACVLGHKGYHPSREAFNGNLLTRSAEMFYSDRAQQIANPDLVMRGVTYQWVVATMESIMKLSDPIALADIDQRVHMWIAGDDQVVDNSVLPFYQEYLTYCSCTHFSGARHQILSETSDVQQKIYHEIIKFCDNLPLHNTALTLEPTAEQTEELLATPAPSTPVEYAPS